MMLVRLEFFRNVAAHRLDQISRQQPARSANIARVALDSQVKCVQQSLECQVKNGALSCCKEASI